MKSQMFDEGWKTTSVAFGRSTLLPRYRSFEGEETIAFLPPGVSEASDVRGRRLDYVEPYGGAGEGGTSVQTRSSSP